MLSATPGLTRGAAHLFPPFLLSDLDLMRQEAKVAAAMVEQAQQGDYDLDVSGPEE
jgi:hypothetical protein